MIEQTFIITAVPGLHRAVSDISDACMSQLQQILHSHCRRLRAVTCNFIHPVIHRIAVDRNNAAIFAQYDIRRRLRTFAKYKHSIRTQTAPVPQRRKIRDMQNLSRNTVLFMTFRLDMAIHLFKKRVFGKRMKSCQKNVDAIWFFCCRIPLAAHFQLSGVLIGYIIQLSGSLADTLCQTFILTLVIRLI